MPIEIRELHVRVSVSQPAAQTGAAPSANRASSTSATPDALISTCVDQVLHILESKRER